MGRSLRVAAAAAAGVAALTSALSASAAPPAMKTPAQVARAGEGIASCYPTNEFTIWSGYGDFRAYAQGIRTNAVVEGTTKAAKVSYEFAQSVTGNTAVGTPAPPFEATPGSMSGTIEVKAKIGRKTVKFETRCIAEAQVEDDGGGDQLIEAELEGYVRGAPWGSGPAVLSITAQTELTGSSGDVGSYRILIEQGVTCDELGNSIAFTGEGGFLSMDPVLASGESRGRAGLPDGYFPDANGIPSGCEDAAF